MYTIIQDLMRIDHQARTYGSVYFGWHYLNNIDCSCDTWNSIHDYLGEQANNQNIVNCTTNVTSTK